MSRTVKLLIGLLLALLAGMIWHGPAGYGEKLVSGIEADARNLVAQTNLPGLAVRAGRDPLRRDLVVSGEANDLQREGLGSQNGVLDYARAAPNVGSVRWEDEKAGFSLPLLAETLIVTLLAFLIGFGVATPLFNRPRKHSFLD
jgi:hypothetical protein